MMYNTGDICRWREDGLIEILGRQDDQIKIKVSQVDEALIYVVLFYLLLSSAY